MSKLLSCSIIFTQLSASKALLKSINIMWYFFVVRSQFLCYLFWLFNHFDLPLPYGILLQRYPLEFFYKLYWWCVWLISFYTFRILSYSFFMRIGMMSPVFWYCWVRITTSISIPVLGSCAFILAAPVVSQSIMHYNDCDVLADIIFEAICTSGITPNSYFCGCNGDSIKTSEVF